MMSKFCIILFLVVSICNYCTCARILGIFNVPSKSHHILGSSLLQGLAKKGHEVTMISPYPFKEKVKNYRDIFVEEMLQFKEDNFRSFMKPKASIFEKPFLLPGIFANMSDIVLSHEEVQKLKTENFELIIQFALFTEGFLGLAYHFNAPVILFSTMGSSPPIDRVVGNVAPPSYLSTMSLSVPGEMTFLERVRNVLSLSMALVRLPATEAYQERVIRKHFPEAPPLQELQKKIALVFLNSHYSLESPRPYVPNIIQIGGVHVADPKELAPELKKFLDEAPSVFFSLGSNVKMSSLPSRKVQAILSVLGRLNMNVIFKSDKVFEKLPSNIKTGNWLPQNDILAHPNMRLFISHGGYLSTIEAVYHGVPIIGIPIFGDQHKNIIDATYKGYALGVDLNRLSEESFSRDIQEILSNSSYRRNIELRSSLMRGQPLKPLDKAIFWVEHVLKHKGADHLKNGGVKLYLYQYLLLDVVAFIVAVFLLAVLLIKFLIKKTISVVKVVSGKIKFKRE